MKRMIVFFGLILIPAATSHNSVVFRNSNAQLYNHKVVFADEKAALNYKGPHKLELIIDVKDLSQPPSSSNEKSKRRRERVQKRKEKGGKFSRDKNKPPRSSYDLARHALRNEEKATLVRNRTIQILKSGLRILNPSENYPQNEDLSASRVNETLLEKILLSTSHKHDILLSATGAYKLPVGTDLYDGKTDLTVNRTLMSASEEDLDRQQRQNGSENRNPASDHDYEYDFLSDFQMNSTNDLRKAYETVNLDRNVGTALEQIVNALKNLSNCSIERCNQDENIREDSCQKWLNCREGLDRAFARDNHLPSCPCTYPSSIFYEETVWDKKNKKYFRWRDASGESERLDIYKPGAAYCIRSLLTQGSLSVSSQQCCYDRNLQLLTRGSGAGTINFISPEVSRKLHNTVDILPWRLCKGDFTRYNKARNPNNGNNCPENPGEEEYQLQMLKQKITESIQEVILPYYLLPNDDDNTVTTTVTKSRRVSFGPSFIKEFIVDSAISAQCMPEHEQPFPSSDSSSADSVNSALSHGPFALQENAHLHKSEPEAAENRPKPPKFASTICFSADSSTADMEFTCITRCERFLSNNEECNWEETKENRMPLDAIMRYIDKDESDEELFNPEKSFAQLLAANSLDSSDGSEKLNLNESMEISGDSQALNIPVAPLCEDKLSELSVMEMSEKSDSKEAIQSSDYEMVSEDLVEAGSPEKAKAMESPKGDCLPEVNNTGSEGMISSLADLSEIIPLNEPSIADLKLIESLKEQTMEEGCAWSLKDVQYPQKKEQGLLSLSCRLLESTASLQFILKMSNEDRLISWSRVTGSSIFLDEEKECRHPEYLLAVGFGFEELVKYFRSLKKVDTIRQVPYFMDLLNSFLSEMNGYLVQIHSILTSYPGSRLKDRLLSFRLFSFPVLFSCVVSINLSDVFRLSRASLTFEHDFGRLDENKVGEIFEQSLKGESSLCEFVVQSTKYLVELERPTGCLSKRNHIGLLPEEVKW